MWTRFMDMHSGGGRKLNWEYIYIEAPRSEAVSVFYARFGRNPSRVTCTCCGDDYSLDEELTLAQATAYSRGLRYVQDIPNPTTGLYAGEGHVPGFYLEPDEPVPVGRELSAMSSFRNGDGVTLDHYLEANKESVLVIYEADIQPDERNRDVPDEGYVWQ